MTMPDWLKTECPILQAPMAGVQDGGLAIAVCQGGGLGALPCAMLGTETIRDEVARIRAQTDRPFNLNFFAHTPPTPDPEREAAWQARFADYYKEFGVDPASGGGPERRPFDEEMAALVRALRPPVVSFHFGLPADDLLAEVRAAGARILASATTVEEARWLEARGVDAIIAQGLEAGGHRGMFLDLDLTTQLGTIALVPQVVQAVRVPVIAAGGIADAQGVRAALTLGAAAALVGTAYLLCREATTRAVHRAALKCERGQLTAITNVFSGRPARGIVNRLMADLGPMAADAPAFPLAATASAPLRTRAESLGRDDFSPLWAGQNTRGCREIPADRLTRSLAGLP